MQRDCPPTRGDVHRSTSSAAPSAELSCLGTSGIGNAERSGLRNKIVPRCEASTPPRHRTRCAPTVSAASPLLHIATHSFNGWRCCPIPPLPQVLFRQRVRRRSPLRAGAIRPSPVSLLAVHSHYLPGGFWRVAQRCLVDLTFPVYRLKARNWRCHDKRETVFIIRSGRRGEALTPLRP